MHFGAGSYEGGYICPVGDEIDLFCSALKQIYDLKSYRSDFRGRVINLDRFKSGDTRYKLNGKDLDEKPVSVNLFSIAEESDEKNVEITVDENANAGVDVFMSDIQRLDLIKCLRIARYGRLSQIPNEGSYKRIGKDGMDTWSKGTSVEKKHMDESILPLDK